MISNLTFSKGSGIKIDVDCFLSSLMKDITAIETTVHFEKDAILQGGDVEQDPPDNSSH